MLMVRGIALYSEFVAYNLIRFRPLTKGVYINVTNWTRVWLWPRERESISFKKKHTDIVLLQECGYLCYNILMYLINALKVGYLSHPVHYEVDMRSIFFGKMFNCPKSDSQYSLL